MSTTGPPTGSGDGGGDGGDTPPLPGYDELSAGELEHRVRSLSHGELTDLMRYERKHAARTPVIAMLSARRRQLEAGAEPTPGGSPRPAHGEGAAGGSPVSPAGAGEPVHPPPHGTPDQSGSPKGDRRR
jgi:hypothetical protein